MAGLTANEMAERLGLTTNGARRMLNRLSRVVPATKIDDAWAICGSDGSFDD
jgi:DNA-binding IclR family transcriptional regulator